ncbi:hydroxymethylpyrimidine/phosphomethylpyrimidine kinase [Massilia sp. SR12]
MSDRPCVLVFSGADPSGGAGMAADIQAITAMGAHALPVLTAITVQDNNRVHAVLPVAPEVLLQQARTLMAQVPVAAVKIGIPGSAENALAIAQLIGELCSTRHQAAGAAPAWAQKLYREPPVVLDPVLRSGNGDALGRDDAVRALAPLLSLATLITPNGPEAASLASGAGGASPGNAGNALAHAHVLRALGCRHVLVTGGHDEDSELVINRWLGPDRQQNWSWPRLPGSFHGSGCTLAAAVAALLALGDNMAQALTKAQGYTQRALAASYAIAPGQRIPQR